MRRTLLVTNDFPPVVGGIQRYLADFASFLPADDFEVLTSTPAVRAVPRLSGHAANNPAASFDATLPYRVHRHPTRVLLPTPSVSAHMREIIRDRQIETVWFGAAAPLGLLGSAAKRAGASRVIATTHGHEVGWALFAPSRAALRKVFSSADVVTYISEYTFVRLRGLVPAGTEMVRLPSGIDTDRFRPDGAARAALRARYRLGEAPTVVCVSRLVPRKGQDALIEAWPAVREAIPDARLVIVGWGPYAKRLAELKRESPARDAIVLTGAVAEGELAGHVAMGDVFAMPCRTRNMGADVEGLGIVFLEASACGVPVVAGDSGGAPETVVQGETGVVVDGRSRSQIVDALVRLLSDRAAAQAMGAAGRASMEESWAWPHLVDRLVGAIDER